MDLDKFTLSPERVLKSLSVLSKLGVDIYGDVTKSNISSANSAHLCSWGPHITPLMSGLHPMAIASVLIAIVNMSGERGQPCLVPLWMLNPSE